MLIRTNTGSLIPITEIGALNPKGDGQKDYGSVHGAVTKYELETDTVLSMVPATGWECLLFEGNFDFVVEPLLAIGLNCFGRPVLITPEIVLDAIPRGPMERALRQIATDKVYSAYGTYDSAETWLRDAIMRADNRAEDEEAGDREFGDRPSNGAEF